MIIAIRHPRPALAPDICYGQLDVGLADPCDDSARDILRRLGATGAERVVTSPLRRAHDIATLLAEGLGLPLIVEPRLQEMNFGAWEGRAWATIARGDLDAWAGDVLSYRPGGGECAHDLMRRVEQVRREAVASGRAQIWVTHAGPIRCLVALSEDRPLDEVLRRDVPFGLPLYFDGAGPDAANQSQPGSTVRYDPRR